MSSPYREASIRVDAVGLRWGATPWVRFATFFARVARENRRAALLEYREAKREELLACWERMRNDAGFLYSVSCTCGNHYRVSVPSRVAGKLAESWPYIEPLPLYGRRIWAALRAAT